MADCNSIESLLNELLDKLNKPSACCEELRQEDIQIKIAIALLKEESRKQRLKIDELIRQFIKFEKSQKEDKTIPARLKRAELQIKSQISFTAKLDTRLKKLDNDFRYAANKFRQEIDDLQKQIIAIVGVGGLLFLLGEKLDKLVKSVDVVKDGIKALDKALTALERAFKVLEEGLKTIGKIVDLIKKFIDNPKNKGEKGDRGQTGQKGDKGDKGDRGLTGQKGDQGSTGSKGDRGESGSKGSTGDKGDRGLTGQKGDQGSTGSKGDKGDKGDQGESGLKGDKGDQGEPGVKGDKGDRGEAGLKGDKGDQGETGLKGEKGEEGEVQIVETEKVVYKDPEYESCVIKKFDKCDLTNNEPVFISETIQVIKGHGLATQKLFEQVADIEALQCRKSEAIAAIPEYWAVRPMSDRPQLVVMFGEVLPNGKFGSAKYPICIPHYIGTRGNKPVLPNYKKGQIEGKLTLKDNSKLVVNAESESEAERVINAIKPYINRAMINSDKVQFTNRKGEELAKITVAPRNLSYFSTGQKSSTPDYRDLY